MNSGKQNDGARCKKPRQYARRLQSLLGFRMFDGMSEDDLARLDPEVWAYFRRGSRPGEQSVSSTDKPGPATP